MLKNTIEAILFASGEKLSRKELFSGLRDFYDKKDIEDAIAELKNTYCGECGIILTDVNDNLQFQTNANYGALLKDLLQEKREKELSKTLLQVLAIIAYKQPITKLEIEELRGTSADYVVSALINLDLIQPVGRRETLGYPILYGTTDEFLKKFGLSNLQDMPDYEQIITEIRTNYDKYYAKRDGLYFDRDIDMEDDGEQDAIDNPEVTSAVDSEEDDEFPDFLEDEDIVEID